MKQRGIFSIFALLFAGVLFGQPATRVSEFEALPQGFEPNLGQTDSQVRFLAHGRGVGLFLTPSEVVWSLSKSGGKDAPSVGSAVRLKLLGANVNAEIAGDHLLPGHSSYIYGSDPGRWRSNVPRYEKVHYRNLYPGVDLVFYRSSERQLEFDFQVAPGADPRRIQMGFEGAQDISIDASGDIVLRTPAGDIRTKAPRVYQRSNGVTREIKGRYALSGRNRVRFELAAYDHSRPLVIDPVVYSTYLGGAGTDVGQDLGEDAAGNYYVTGITQSTNFPTKAAFQTGFEGVEDAFVTKLNFQTGIVYSTYIGGTGDEQARSMAVADAGDVYITGPTNSTDFPTTPGAFQTTGGGACPGGKCAHAFVAHLSPSGALVYSTYLGSTPGSGDDQSQGIAIDAAGNAYVSGTTNSRSFPTTAGAYRTMLGGGICRGAPCSDAFVSKLNPTGSALVYSTYLGGSNQDFGTGIAVDATGDAFITGGTISSDFPTSPGAFQTKLKVAMCAGVPCFNAFVTELNPMGSALVYSTLVAGTGGDTSFDIDVNASGQAYIIGTTGSADFPTTAGAFQTKFGGGGTDVFVTALNSTGTALVASTYIGGNGADMGNGISISDTGDDVILAIDTTSANFPQPSAGPGAAPGQQPTFDTSSTVVKLDRAMDTLSTVEKIAADGSRRKGRKKKGRTCSTGGVGPTYVLPATSGVPGPRFNGGDADAVLVCTEDAVMLPALMASPQSLSFSGMAGGAPPGSQSLAISSTSGQPLAFSVTTDIGAPNLPGPDGPVAATASTPSPGWLMITPSNGTTPALAIVSVNQNVGPLGPGVHTARILIGAPNSTQPPVIVIVTLNVTSAPAQLAVAPASVSFVASPKMTRPTPQTVVVEVVSGGAQTYIVSIPNQPGWLKKVSPMSGTVAPGSPAFAVIDSDSTGLPSGVYKTTIIFVSNGETIPVTVTLFVANAGSVLGVSQTGMFFELIQGQGTTTKQTFEVRDDGDPTSTIKFAAMIANNANWLNLSPTTEATSPGKPAVITATINGNGQKLGTGVYYALVKITASNAQDSPRYVVVVLQVLPANTSPSPDPYPRGLLFIAAPGGVLPAPETITAYVSGAATTFQASASLANGGTFLTVSPASGTLSTQNPAELTASVNISGVPAGVYQGTINISVGGVFVSVDVTIIVLPPGNFSAAQETDASALVCTPSRVVLTETGLPTGFSVPGGFPATLAVLMNDDCGHKITNGSVVATFSNGDPALVLESDMTGMYSATWQPGNAPQQTTVTASGTSGTLKAGSVQITGNVNQNPAPPPVLAHGGTVNSAYPAGLLSPGVDAQVFGANLATKSATPGVVPLVTSYQGTSLLVGARSVPLFFISGKQINVEIPAELTPGLYQIIANFHGALSLPDTLALNSFGPGILSTHHSNGKLVNSADPAKPGEPLVISLVGLGATKPPVPSGHPSPSKPPANAVVQPVVTVHGQKAKVTSAGLAPGGVGLYQINFQVPSTAPNGALDLIVTQNGVAGNTTKLTVSK
jgi:uncharacterized protein (TIGR03437 family)